MELDNYIRKIENYPKDGILFYDITTALEKGEVFRYMVDKMVEPFEDEKIDKVVGIDARGFLFAAAIGYKLGKGVCLVRKKGKLPYKTIGKEFVYEYASDTIEMHEDTIVAGEKVLLVDDLVATGGTISTATKLIEQMKGEIVGISYVIDLPFLGGREKIKNYKLNWLVEYNHENIKTINQ